MKMDMVTFAEIVGLSFSTLYLAHNTCTCIGVYLGIGERRNDRKQLRDYLEASEDFLGNSFGSLGYKTAKAFHNDLDI